MNTPMIILIIGISAMFVIAIGIQPAIPLNRDHDGSYYKGAPTNYTAETAADRERKAEALPYNQAQARYAETERLHWVSKGSPGAAEVWRIKRDRFRELAALEEAASPKR